MDCVAQQHNVRHVKRSVCQRLCAAVWAGMGDACLHPEKDAMQAVLCTARTALLLRAPILLQTWGEAQWCRCLQAFAEFSGIEARRRFTLTAQNFSCFFLVNIQAQHWNYCHMITKHQTLAKSVGSRQLLPLIYCCKRASGATASAAVIAPHANNNSAICLEGTVPPGNMLYRSSSARQHLECR